MELDIEMMALIRRFQWAFKIDCVVGFPGVFLILLVDGIVNDCGGSNG
jgi:hypothetical protein